MSNFRRCANRLIEKARAGWPQSAFKRGLIQSLTVMLITTCVWMSGRTPISLQTSQHSIQPNHDRRLLSRLSDTESSQSEDSSEDGYEREESHFPSSPASTVPQGRLPSEEADSTEDRSWLQFHESADSRHEPEDWELLILDRIRQTAESQDHSDDDVDSPELYPIVSPVSANRGSDRDNEVSNFPQSPTNTLPQESSMDDLELDRRFARNLRLRREERDAKDRKETAEKHLMEFMQKKRQRERKFPNVKSFNYWTDRLKLGDAIPQSPGKQESSSAEDSTEIIWNEEKLRMLKPIFEAEIRMNHEKWTRTLFLQWNSESTLHFLYDSSRTRTFTTTAVVQKSTGQWIRLPTYPQEPNDYSREQDVSRILSQGGNDCHTRLNRVGGSVSEFPLTFPQQVSWGLGTVTLKKVVHWDCQDAPHDSSEDLAKQLLQLQLAEAEPRYEIGKQQHNQFHVLEIMENRHIRDLDKIEKGESEAFAKESKPDPQRVASDVITPQAKPSLIPQARKRNPADRQREILVRTKARQKMLSKMAANVRLPVDIPEMVEMYPVDVTSEMDPVGIPETDPVEVPEMDPNAEQMFL